MPLKNIVAPAAITAIHVDSRAERERRLLIKPGINSLTSSVVVCARIVISLFDMPKPYNSYVAKFRKSRKQRITAMTIAIILSHSFLYRNSHIPIIVINVAFMQAMTPTATRLSAMEEASTLTGGRSAIPIIENMSRTAHILPMNCSFFRSILILELMNPLFINHITPGYVYYYRLCRQIKLLRLKENEV